MPLADVPGQNEGAAKFGACTAYDFREVRIVQIETYYEEDREVFEKGLLPIRKGPKGVIECRFTNVTGFKRSNLWHLGSFDVKDICSYQLEQKRCYFEDDEADGISGYTENAQVAVCENQDV